MSMQIVQIRQLRFNFLSLSAAEVIAKILGALLYVVVARYLGPEQFGIYSLAISFGIILGIFANLGLDPLIIKDVARDFSLSGRYFSHAVLLKLIGGTLSFIMVLIATYFLGYAPEVRLTILIFSCSFFIMPLNAAQQAIFKAHQKMGYGALMNALRPLINVVLILIAIAVGWGVQVIVGVHVVRAFIIFVVFYFFVLRRTFCRFTMPEDFKFFLPLLRSASPFMLIGVFYILNSKVDILVISKLVGVKAVGWYSAANELVGMLLLIPTMLSTILFPGFSNDYGRSDTQHLAKSGSFAIKVLNVIGIPSGLGLFILAPEIIEFVYGTKYLESVIVLRILSFAPFLFFAQSIISWLLTSIDRVKILMKINMVALVLNITLDILLVPILGFAAAAIGTLVSMGLSYVLICWFLTRHLKKIVIFRTFVKPMFAGAVMIAILLLLGHFNLFLKIGVGMGIYFLVGFIIPIFDSKEMMVLKQIFTFSS